MQTTLFLGWVWVPTKFLGECKIIMRLFASAAKITVSISLTNCRSLVTLLLFELKILLKSFKFWFPALLLAWLINQLDQVVCVAVVLYFFRIYSLIWLRGCVAQSVANQKVRLEWDLLVFICPTPKVKNSECILNFPSAFPRSLAPRSASKQLWGNVNWVEDIGWDYEVLGFGTSYTCHEGEGDLIDMGSEG